MNRRWLTTLGIVLAVAVVGFLVYEIAHHWWAHNFVVRTLDFVVSGLASRSGISPFLVKGLVILLTIPFFWAVGKYTHGLLWLRGVGPSLRLYRNPYGLTIVGYAGLFFITMYFASLDACAYKWCADTPEGIRTFDSAGIDPIYRIPLKPCTPEQCQKIRHVPGPQRLQIDNPRQFEFFDGITGQPRVWYYKPAAGTYDLYDRPGKHPGTGEDLRPIDSQAIQELVRLKEMEEAKRAESEIAARKQEAEQAAATQKREHEALLDRYINTEIAKRPGRKIAAILILPQSQESFSNVESALMTSLSSQGIEPVSSFFKPAYVQEGRARRFLVGNWNEATQLDLSKRIDYVVSGPAAVTYSSSGQFEGLITANLQVELKCLNVVTQRVCGSRTVAQTGAGYTKSAALETAANKAKQQLEDFVKALRLD